MKELEQLNETTRPTVDYGLQGFLKLLVRDLEFIVLMSSPEGARVH